MKNTFKLLSVIAMVALIGFSFIACDLEDPGNDNVDKILKINGIPSSFNGKQITVAITDNDKKGDPKIVALAQVDSKENVTAPLFSGNENKRGEAFTGTGKFYILLFFDVNNTKSNLKDDDTYAYTMSGNIPYKYEITEETTTLNWSDFKLINE